MLWLVVGLFVVLVLLKPSVIEGLAGLIPMFIALAVFVGLVYLAFGVLPSVEGFTQFLGL